MDTIYFDNFEATVDKLVCRLPCEKRPYGKSHTFVDIKQDDYNTNKRKIFRWINENCENAINIENYLDRTIFVFVNKHDAAVFRLRFS